MSNNINKYSIFCRTQFGQIFHTKYIYDFIIVGGGSCGCILANRLSENKNFRILLIGAGPEKQPKDILDTNSIENDKYDQHYKT